MQDPGLEKRLTTTKSKLRLQLHHHPTSRHCFFRVLEATKQSLLYVTGRNINRCNISEEQCSRNSIRVSYPRNILQLMHKTSDLVHYLQPNSLETIKISINGGLVDISVLGCTLKLPGKGFIKTDN